MSPLPSARIPPHTAAHTAMIKRCGKFALTMLTFTAIAACIVAMKAAVLIPQFPH